jgi:hypothetical protein
MILAGVRSFQHSGWNLEDDVYRVQLHRFSAFRHTLSAHLHYKDDRPDLVLELYHLSDGLSIHSSYIPLSNLCFKVLYVYVLTYHRQ